MTAESVRTNDEAEIRALLDDRHSAMQAKDASRFVAHYAPDIVLFDLAPPLQFSSAQALDPAGIEEWFATWRGPIEYTISQVKLAIGDDVAFCHGLARLRGTKTGGEQVDVWTRATIGLCKIDGTWKVAHEHLSVPFYMDGSGRAALDLRP